MRIPVMGLLLTAAGSGFGAEMPPFPGATRQDQEALRNVEVAVKAGARQAWQEALTGALDAGGLHFAFGPDDNGKLGASLSGGKRVGGEWLRGGPQQEPPKGASWSHVGYLEYASDGSLTAEQDAANNFTMSLRPGISWIRTVSPVDTGRPTRDLADEQQKACADSYDDYIGGKLDAVRASCPLLDPPVPTFAIAAFGDLRYRYGNVAAADGTVTRVNQSIIGGGAEIYWMGASALSLFEEWPRFGIGYYNVASTDDVPVQLPDSLTANHVVAWTRMRLNVPLALRHDPAAGDSYPFRVHGEWKFSKPTSGPVKEWEQFALVQLVADLGEELKPAISFREGEEQGLEFDRQLLFGLLYELAK